MYRSVVAAALFILLLLSGCVSNGQESVTTATHGGANAPVSGTPVLQVTETLTATSMLPAVVNQPATAPSIIVHVATDGDDANDGSVASPWRTVQHAVDNVPAGGAIYVHEGSYAGARIQRSGTSDAPLTLQAAPGMAAHLDRPGPENEHDSILELETWEGDGIVAYWQISGLELSGASGWGIDIRGSDGAHSHHITIANNRVHDNGLANENTGIFAAFADYVTVIGNESYDNGEHGVYVNNSSDYFTIVGNHIYGNGAAGIHLNGDASFGGDGVLSDGLVAQNIIHDNGVTGGAAINMDGVADTAVRNNLIYRNHATGIALYQIDGAVCSQNNRVHHNTILMPADGRWAILISDPSCTGNHIVNNIIYSDHSFRGAISLPSTAVAGLVSDYNTVVDRFSTDDGDNTIAFSDWQALGFDTHSLLAAPAQLFVDTGSDDFHLSAGSLALDAGVTLPEVVQDLENNPRPSGGGYDIGAYERQTAQ